MFPALAKETLDGAKWGIIASFDWFFLLSANIFVIVSLALIFMPVGKIRLGGQDAKPEFTTLSWFAMLFAAGDRKSTRLNSSHVKISYAVFCLKKKRST